MVMMTEVMPQERLDRYIEEAAQAAGYEEGFGVRGCDLSQKHWWSAYSRQSLREQAENDRVADYLLTCARLAKQLGVVVPIEYIIYDADSSEHLGRPGITRIRRDLVAGRCIAGVIIPALGRLSMDNLHRETFERECQYYGVRFMYGDAPSDMAWWSRAARSQLCYANEVRVTDNRGNAVGGNKSRCLAGKVPAGRAPYGYRYCRNAYVDQRGRPKISEAWWEIDELGPDGELIWGSAGWVVFQIFIWIGNDEWTQYWVASKLNELRQSYPTLFRPLYGDRWAPKMVGDIVAREGYTGKAHYNKNYRVPNPKNPFPDPTLGLKRTLLRPKPDDERVSFTVPSLTTHELWERSNQTLRERGRGRGKQGKSIQALFRMRMICPICGKPMAVKRGKHGEVYYYCRAHYRKWLPDSCPYNRFIPAKWDDEIWQDICNMLRDDTWVEKQLEVKLNRTTDLNRLTKLQRVKIDRRKQSIAKVETGYNEDLYTIEEAKKWKDKYLQDIQEAEVEITRLNSEVRGFTQEQAQDLYHELKRFRELNLNEATFDEKADLVARLGIKICPSEDLKTRRIICRLNIENNNGEREQVGVAKGVFGRPYRSRTCDTLIKSHGVSNQRGKEVKWPVLTP